MKELILNDKCLKTLRTVIYINDSLIEKTRINVNIIKTDKYFLEEMLDNLSNYLLQNGLDENDEPNSVGIKIEQLIDKVSKLYYDNIS